LHAIKQSTFFTRDLGFFRARLSHANYCLVVLAVPVLDTASYIRKLLRHPGFETRADRNGKIVKVTTERIILWEAGRQRQQSLYWKRRGGKAMIT
jgi:hypothetical protein